MALGDHLIITQPECPTCHTEVSCDGTSYWCDGCSGTWNIDGTALDDDRTS